MENPIAKLEKHAQKQGQSLDAWIASIRQKMVDERSFPVSQKIEAMTKAQSREESLIYRQWVLQKIPSALQRETQMLEQAKTELLQSGDWLAKTDITDLTRSQANKWKQLGKIFTLSYEGIEYFPIYALDKTKNSQPFSVLEMVISTLATTKNEWAIAFWFASPNTFLNGKRPKDVLSENPSGVLSAAREEAAGITHG
jgi:hypothetical protein